MSNNNNGTPPVYYPLLLDVKNQPSVVVGGGQVARRKVDSLLEAGADITVIAPKFVEMPVQVHIIPRAFRPADLDGALLVIAATDNRDINAEIARAAKARHILVNVVDDPDLCSIILPAVVRRGALSIAVSTGGASPTLARNIRQQLEECYSTEYGELVELLWRLRHQWEPLMFTSGMEQSARQAIWAQLLALPLLELLREGKHLEAENLAQKLFEQTVQQQRSGE